MVPPELELLHAPDSTTDVEVDIIFVHGLLGDYRSTWTHPETQTLWPKDLLPRDLSRARILAFKYSPTLPDFFPEEDRRKDRFLTKLSYMLLEAVDKVWEGQDSTTRRPLILVGHNLGGLLCLSAALHGDVDFLSNLEGIVFFGTPFMDRSDERWLDLAVNLSKLNGPSIESPSLDQKFCSAHFSYVISDFRRALQFEDSIYDCSLVYLCESLPMDRNGVEDYVVDEDAAVLSVDGVPNVGAAMCIEGDHESFCKFANADCDNYQRVLEALQQIISKRTSSIKRESMDKQPMMMTEWKAQMKNIASFQFA